MTGKISLMLIKKVSGPITIDYGSEKVTIADAGYSWVQAAPEGQYFWITSILSTGTYSIAVPAYLIFR